MASAAAPEPKDNMGPPAPRYDARLKVTGEARYPADIPVANPAYAVLVTSTIAEGSKVSISTMRARWRAYSTYSLRIIRKRFAR
jgi:xanthine dehydrogenase YagR molybdenum-binding subunit